MYGALPGAGVQAWFGEPAPSPADHGAPAAAQKRADSSGPSQGAAAPRKRKVRCGSTRRRRGCAPRRLWLLHMGGGRVVVAGRRGCDLLAGGLTACRLTRLQRPGAASADHMDAPCFNNKSSLTATLAALCPRPCILHNPLPPTAPLDRSPPPRQRKQGGSRSTDDDDPDAKARRQQEQNKAAQRRYRLVVWFVLIAAGF